MTDPDSSNSDQAPSATHSDASASHAEGSRSEGEPPPAASPERCQVDIQNPCRYREVGARQLRPLIERIVRELAPEARTFALRFVSDREMRRLNGEFRQKDRPTDVLSFPGDLADLEPADLEPADLEPAGLKPAVQWLEGKHLGDIAISIPTARRQASERGGSIEREIRVLALHGILHCLGYDHEEDDGEMERLEFVLRQRFLPQQATV